MRALLPRPGAAKEIILVRAPDFGRFTRRRASLRPAGSRARARSVVAIS
jgi:hypothetical protein